ncbi:chorismate--pyruvate lyase family protein [Gallaecimonas xiamenensis]|uniref:Chorismate pyruvate lyase UbiC n=1 Tax=Gallaecimonas xiamenensis 3-C-1 TaxID=745411 RepID=K2JQ94_9GAMM|nr:chorismate lyase [Gallaecimonas xiamenensis]EKE77483.1 chorismate pyruvate lyase UbiC [Gallaecimonas xiamenensis 3-C-1]
MWSDWQWMSTAQVPALTALERDWLLGQGSMTARLKSRSTQFRVQLLGVDDLSLSPHQAQWLGLPTDVTERTVLLLADEAPCIFAKSLWAGPGHPFSGLGEQPLGEKLFDGDQWRRGGIQIAKVRAAELGLDFPDTSLWARCSAFKAEGKPPVWVMEAFLPPIYRLDTL